MGHEANPPGAGTSAGGGEYKRKYGGREIRVSWF